MSRRRQAALITERHEAPQRGEWVKIKGATVEEPHSSGDSGRQPEATVKVYMSRGALYCFFFFF